MLEIIAPAKINLFLEITGKLENGYHTVDTVMQSISLADTISLELLPAKDGIVISCDIPGIPTDERNIAYKTARAYLEASGADCGVYIDIKKRIPSEAGMGGGSADGAAVFAGLNRLCGSLVTDSMLCEIAASKGADIPFCIEGGTKRLDGIGTRVCESFRSPSLPIVIAKPQRGISTPAAYGCLDRIHADFENHSPVTPEKLLQALRMDDAENIASNLFNRFEEIQDALCPEVCELITFMRDNSHAALLCGSGTAVFAVADSNIHAEKLEKMIKCKYPEYFTAVSRTVSHGCLI